jgi:hypothetical protein
MDEDSITYKMVTQLHHDVQQSHVDVINILYNLEKSEKPNFLQYDLYLRSINADRCFFKILLKIMEKKYNLSPITLESGNNSNNQFSG